MKTFAFVTAAAMTALTLNAATPAQPGFVNPNDVNDNDWYEWTDWTTCHISYGSFHGGFEEDGIQLQKRVAKDAAVTKYQVKIVGYFSKWDLVFEYDPATQAFSMPSQYFGIESYYYEAPLFVSGYKEYWGSDDPYSSFDEVEGIINLYSVCHYEGLDYGLEYAKGLDVLKLDGYTKYDVDILSDECVYSFDHEFFIEFTQHPHDVCYEIIQGTATDTKIDRVAADKKNPLTESANIKATLAEGLNTVVVISYDNQNNRYVSLREIYCMPADTENWKALGTGKLTEDAITGLGSELSVVTYDVAIEENISRPGFYRIVDPYIQFPDLFPSEPFFMHADHTHYIYLDATEPSQVMLRQTTTGMTHQRLGMMYLTSKAYEGQMAGQLKVEYAPYFGTLENGKITFPKDAIGVRLPAYYDGIFWVNNTGKFSVDIPDEAGIDGVTADEAAENGEAEYFNLQGIRITNPENGNLYIRRCGGKSSKVIFRN